MLNNEKQIGVDAYRRILLLGNKEPECLLASCFCTVHEQRMAFTFLNTKWFKESKEKLYSMKFKFQYP